MSNSNQTRNLGLSLMLMQYVVFHKNLWRKFFFFNSSDFSYKIMKSIFLIVFTVPFLCVFLASIVTTAILGTINALVEGYLRILVIPSVVMNLVMFVVGAVFSIVFLIFTLPDTIFIKSNSENNQ